MALSGVYPSYSSPPRTKIIPVSPGAASRRSSRRIRTDTPRAVRPMVFGEATRSLGEAMATTPASVEPYPLTRIGPNASSTPDTVDEEIGAAPVTIIRSDSCRASRRSRSGSASIRCNMTGTAISTVTRCRRMSVMAC
ncbi:Uncharacterised protein [Mycobacteroides abscessus subsp. abscessus]|nr:Uncharacterised protein [Mycobacteroides abscessus subsp. abscessus]